MIIDAHAHIGMWQDGGNYAYWRDKYHQPYESVDFTPELVVDLMNRAHIDMALISNLEGVGAETDQSEANRKTKSAVEMFPDRLRGLVWVNPRRNQGTGLGSDVDDTEACLQLMLGNRYVFVGLKFHPYLNQYPFELGYVRRFLQHARTYDVPVAVHTAYDDFSKPKYALEVAGEFPDVNFILYHAGLNPPDEETGRMVMDNIASRPNIYVDISWLSCERIEHALRLMPERVLFGTDVPLGGPEHYKTYFESLGKLGMSDKERAGLMSENCQNIFKRLVI